MTQNNANLGVNFQAINQTHWEWIITLPSKSLVNLKKSFCAEITIGRPFLLPPSYCDSFTVLGVQNYCVTISVPWGHCSIDSRTSDRRHPVISVDNKIWPSLNQSIWMAPPSTDKRRHTRLKWGRHIYYLANDNLYGQQCLHRIGLLVSRSCHGFESWDLICSEVRATTLLILGQATDTLQHIFNEMDGCL